METNTSPLTATTEVEAEAKILSREQAKQVMAQMRKQLDAIRDNVERLKEWTEDVECEGDDDDEDMKVQAEMTVAQHGRFVARLDYLERYFNKADDEINYALNLDL